MLLYTMEYHHKRCIQTWKCQLTIETLELHERTHDEKVRGEHTHTQWNTIIKGACVSLSEVQQLEKTGVIGDSEEGYAKANRTLRSTNDRSQLVLKSVDKTT